MNDEDDKDDDETDNVFEEDIVDVSDNEILYDEDRNITGEEDIEGGLKEMMKYHMNKLLTKLNIFATLASTKIKDEEEEEEEETRDAIDETS